MGGYSEKCPWCERWFTDGGALAQHAKAKYNAKRDWKGHWLDPATGEPLKDPKPYG